MALGIGISPMLRRFRSSSTLNNGLVYLWEREGNCNTTVGSNNGTDTNVTYTTGTDGQCAVYNATAFSTLSAFQLPSEWTFNFWVKRNTNGTRQLFFGDSNAGGTATTLQLAVEFTALNKLAAYIVDTTIDVGVLSSATTYTDTNWHMVTIDKLGTSVRMYIDNVSEATDTLANATMNTSANIFAFGRSGAFLANYFNGSLDESAYWSRRLTDAERLELLTNFYPY